MDPFLDIYSSHRDKWTGQYCVIIGPIITHCGPSNNG